MYKARPATACSPRRRYAVLCTLCGEDIEYRDRWAATGIEPGQADSLRACTAAEQLRRDVGAQCPAYPAVVCEAAR